MARERTMTGFATQLRVTPFALRFGNIRVAGFARLAPGEFDRLCADLLQHARAKMPVLAEFRWNNKVPYHQERD